LLEEQDAININTTAENIIPKFFITKLNYMLYDSCMHERFNLFLKLSPLFRNSAHRNGLDLMLCRFVHAIEYFEHFQFSTRIVAFGFSTVLFLYFFKFWIGCADLLFIGTLRIPWSISSNSILDSFW